MLTPNFHKLLEKPILVFKIVWAGITISTLILAIAAVVIASDAGAGRPTSDLEFLLIGFAALSVAAVVTSLKFWSYVPSRETTEKWRTQLEQTGNMERLITHAPGTAESGESCRELFDALSDDEKTVLFSFQRLIAFCIVAWALNESLAVFGFILVVLSGSASIGVPFFLGSIVLNMFMFPRPMAKAEAVLRHLRMP